MRAAEEKAIAAGVSSAALMENAGAGVAQAAIKGWSKRPVTVVCGPGNNGGDGYVAARRLKEAGWETRICRLHEEGALQGDARLMADLYDGPVAPFAVGAFDGAGLIIDALFGAGLSRPLEGEALAVVKAMNATRVPVLAVDLPSGVDADTGAVNGEAVRAARTVTFFAKKPGHVLFPGRAFCGSVDVVDIGVDPGVLAGARLDAFENQPPLWGRALLRPTWQSHKYHRGHVFVVSGGPLNTGAARLAARGAQRMGAGLVTILAPETAAQIVAGHVTAIMVQVADDGPAVAAALQEKAQHRRIAVIGPATGVGEETADKTIAAIEASTAAVVDADALSSFASAPDALFAQLRENDVITPHEGEFARLFTPPAAGGRIGAARAAAATAGCICVLKGADTIIAAPDGRAAICVNAPPDLATAGAGDVLAGLVAGMLASGAPGFEAAAAGAWFHGAAAIAAGPGLTAEDLPEALPTVLRGLFAPPDPGASDAPVVAGDASRGASLTGP